MNMIWIRIYIDGYFDNINNDISIYDIQLNTLNIISILFLLSIGYYTSILVIFDDWYLLVFNG